MLGAMESALLPSLLLPTSSLPPVLPPGVNGASGGLAPPIGANFLPLPILEVTLPSFYFWGELGVTGT
jgi:hypothetical protein